RSSSGPRLPQNRPRSGTAISSPYGVTRFCRGMGLVSHLPRYRGPVTGPAFEENAAFDAEAAAAEVMAAMAPLADPERAGQARRYLKSDLDFLGVSVPGIRSAVTGTARSRPDPGR